jgi:cystathionine gamma-synthase
MRGSGGLVTFLLKDADWRETARVVDAVKIPRIGPSLGGVESLIEQPMVMSYWNYSPAERAAQVAARGVGVNRRFAPYPQS